MPEQVKAPPRYIVRRLQDLEQFRSVCGYRQSILTDQDSERCGLSLLHIRDSSKHYHKRTVEVYYCLEGSGTMELDDEEVALAPGTCILINPGTRHTAKGEVTVLIFSVPPGETDDVWFD